MNNIEINTPCGKIRGLEFDNHYQFRGIKYANAKRWQYPTEITSWSGTYNATEYGACCFQRRAFEPDENCNPFYSKEFRKNAVFKYSEDCQFLNIWAPKNAENAPVLIYIHGGSFTGGSTDENHISGEKYAENGVIFVAMNYRLGPYGFCSHPDLTDKNNRCGNFGLYDQLSAISWVRNNIASFGGDSKKITLLGQSAGAMSVDILVSAKRCKNWFSGAILMSGAGIQRAVARPLAPEKTRAFWDSIIENAGVSTVSELRGVDEKTLYYAWFDACKADKKSMLYTLPVNDFDLVDKSDFNMQKLPDIPYIIGVTATDMVPVAMEWLTKKYAAVAMKNKSGCYVYNFDRLLPGDKSGAWHSCDLLYAFGTLLNNWRPYEKIDYEISHQMIKSFSAFCKNADPNCNAIPKWEKGASRPMHFCENTKSGRWHTIGMIKSTFSNSGAEF